MAFGVPEGLEAFPGAGDLGFQSGDFSLFLSLGHDLNTVTRYELRVWRYAYVCFLVIF